jgi:hypothetical protein
MDGKMIVDFHKGGQKITPYRFTGIMVKKMGCGNGGCLMVLCLRENSLFKGDSVKNIRYPAITK